MERDSGERGAKVKVRQRERSADASLKEGFSVVAPIRVMRPDSTGERKMSCWDFVKRWISSQTRTFAHHQLAATSGDGWRWTR